MQTKEYIKGSLIKGYYNVKFDDYFEKCTSLVNNGTGIKFIKLKDIFDYNILLFPQTKQDILDNINIMEKLNNQSSIFTFNDFIKLLPEYNKIIINQKIFEIILSNSIGRYYINYMEGIYYKDKFIPIEISSINDTGVYFINGQENNILSYKKFIFM